MTRLMIQLSPRGAVIYQYLNLTVALLLLYAVSLLLSALDQLPAQPLGDWAPIIDAVAAQSFELLLLTGFLGAGLMITDKTLGGSELVWQRQIWLSFVAANLVLSALGEIKVADGLTAVVLFALLARNLRIREPTTFLRCWRIGLLLIACSSALAISESERVAAVNAAFQVQVAFTLCSLSIVFWLIPRYSRLDRDWAGDSMRITALLVFLGGSLISLGRLLLPAVVSLAAAPLIAICYILLASHSARALRNRDENASLASHWVGLATIFWLVGGGFLGALSIQPGIAQAMFNTDLAAAQNWLGSWVSLAVVLGFVNEAAASLRGDNHRVTGYAPYWLMAFGVGLSGVLQVCRGTLQIYLSDVAPSAQLDLLLPVTLVWLICLLGVSAGMTLYAIGFWLRRPEIRLVEA